MLAEPLATAVTKPVLETVAMLVLLLDQVYVLLAALEGETAALNCEDAPGSKDKELGVTEIDVTSCSLTVTVQVAFLVLSAFEVAVMVAVPLAIANTLPEF